MAEVIIAGHDDTATTELLEALALNCDLADGVPFTAAVMAHAGFTPEQLQAAWECYAEAVRWREALACGSRHWCEKHSEADLPRGGTPSEAALDLACMVADEARSHLLNGGPR